MRGYKIVLPIVRNLKLASTNKRIISYLIDLVTFMTFFSLPYMTILFFNLNLPIDTMDISLFEENYAFVSVIFSFTNLIIFLFYLTLSEYFLNATFGKRILNLKVININGKKLSFFQALFRNLTKSVFAQLLLFDVFPMFFDKQKRRVSDFIVKTLVVSNKKTIKKYKEVINI